MSQQHLPLHMVEWIPIVKLYIAYLMYGCIFHNPMLYAYYLIYRQQHCWLEALNQAYLQVKIEFYKGILLVILQKSNT